MQESILVKINAEDYIVVGLEKEETQCNGWRADGVIPKEEPK